MQLSVVIVSFNVKYFLEQCLHSVRRAGSGLTMEVIVVDNASTDGSMDYLQPRFPEVLFLPQPNNLGFAKACNLGWQQAKGSHILFLNPDTILAEDTLHLCLHFFEQNPAAGAVGVRMVDGKGVFLKESKRGFPNLLPSFFKMTGLAGLFPRSRMFARYYLGHLSQHQNNEVDVLAGAFMMIPQMVLQQADPFDEAFFMYGEDIDLSYRIQKAGFKNYYLAQTTIVHFKGESTRRASLAYVRRFYGAMHIFVKKHYRGLGAAFLRAALQAAIYSTAAMSVVRTGILKRSGSTESNKTAGQLVGVAGSDVQFQSLASLLARHGWQCTPIKELQQTAALLPGQRLILCEGPHTFKHLLHFIQQHPGVFRYRFHAAGSTSIVGSDSSIGSGEAIGAER